MAVSSLLGRGDAGANYRIVASADLTAVMIAIRSRMLRSETLPFQDRRAFFATALRRGLGGVATIRFESQHHESIVPRISQPTVLLAGTASTPAASARSGSTIFRLSGRPVSATLLLTPGTNRFLVSAIDLSTNRNRRSRSHKSNIPRRCRRS